MALSLRKLCFTKLWNVIFMYIIFNESDVSVAMSFGSRPGLLEEGQCGEFRKNATEDMTIISPNYPENYPDRLSCEKVIQKKPGYVARLYFLDFQLEPSQDCWLDRLEIFLYDDAEERWRLSKYYCDTHKPTLVLSENKIKLHFHTDRYTTYKGFKATLQYIRAS